MVMTKMGGSKALSFIPFIHNVLRWILSAYFISLIPLRVIYSHHFDNEQTEAGGN